MTSIISTIEYHSSSNWFRILLNTYRNSRKFGALTILFQKNTRDDIKITTFHKLTVQSSHTNRNGQILFRIW